jgi:hypothetical protein
MSSRRWVRSRLQRPPTIASAETVVIKRGGYHHHWDGARAEFREHRDRGWHEGWRHRDHDRVVIKERHRY